MRCPRCRDASLDALTTGGGVSVRFCSRCRGMWCDRGHLAPLIGVGPDHPRLLWARRGVALPGDYSCPACGEGSLRSLHVGSSDEIRLEECSSCGGTWINGALVAGIGDFRGSNSSLVVRTTEFTPLLDEPLRVRLTE